jgi:hypothetical protein
VPLYVRLRALRGTVPTFQLCGYTGFALGLLQSMILVRYLGLSPWTQLGITGVIILTFYVLMMATKILAGREIIIYYHHEIAVVATTVLFLRILRQPALPYLDVTVLGIGLFLACGRLGCLMVGCCHGRPCRWGVTYSNDHAREGFPDYLVGVRLFPIQAVESVFALGLVASGIGVIMKGWSPGTAFGLYVLCYAIGRFCFEFVRGDAARPYIWGFSEAQWTSLLAAISESLAEYAGLLPHYRWHQAVPLLLLCAMVTVKVWRDRRQAFHWIHPQHIREIAEAIQLAEGDLSPAGQRLALSFAPESNVIHIAQTSLGLRISGGGLSRGTQHVRYYCLSHANGPLPAASAFRVGTLIGHLRHSCRPFELVPGQAGVFHAIFRV